MRNWKIRNLALTALFSSMGIVISIAFSAYELLGRMFLPMHLSVILCSMICGPLLGSTCAFITVALSSAIIGIPPIYPNAVIIIFELFTYALSSSLVLRLLINKLSIQLVLYVSLLIAMIIGRAVMGVASVVFIGLLGEGYTLQAFLTASFVVGLPGIIIQLILIPWIIMFLQKIGYINIFEKQKAMLL